jgi:hypothetical protein
MSKFIILHSLIVKTGAIAALSFGVDSGLWTLMAENGDKPQQVVELASSLGIDPALLSELQPHIS